MLSELEGIVVSVFDVSVSANGAKGVSTLC